MAAATAMADPTAPPPADPKSTMIELLASIESVRLTLDQMGELVSELGEARVDILRRELRDYHASVNKLQATLFASLALLVLSIVALWWFASRAFISPLKADLTQARQKAASKEALAQIGAMAAAVVHEIRNPITTIRARTFALSGLLENHPAAQKQAHVIEEQIDRLERLSEDFLAFARPSDPKLEDVRIDTFLQDLEDILKEQAAGVRFSMGSLVDARVLMDRGQMAQVLINLVRNATEAAPATEGEVQVSAACMDRQVRISVEDNGSGIPDDILPHLFTPFKTSKQGGSGLGLCVAKNLVDNHGGELKVESHPGQGTVFHIELLRLT